VLQFKRNIELIIGDTEIQVPWNERRGTRIDALNIGFSIKKFLKQSKEGSNSCSIEVYNLSEESRKKLRLDDSFMQLRAGYGDTNELLYSGDIDFIDTKYPAPNIVTTLEAHNLKPSEKEVELSYKENTGAKAVLGAVVNQLGIPIHSDGGISNLLDSSYVEGFTFSGKASDALDRLTNKLDTDWSIQNGTIKFCPRKVPPTRTAAVLSPATGLIGSPEPKYNADKAKKTKANPNPTPISGWVINMLLRPKIEPGDLISVESAAIQKGSFFKVLTVEHTGKFMGNSWNTQVEVVDVDVSYK